MRKNFLKWKIKNRFNHVSFVKKNIILIVLCFTLALFANVGYAALNSNLNITSDLVLRAVKDIRITSLRLASSTNDAYEAYNSKYTTNTISIYGSFPSCSSSLIYTATITNSGNVDMKISELEVSLPNSNISYTLDNLSLNDVIMADQTKTFTLNLQRNNCLVTNSEDANILLELKYIEYEKNYQYVTDGAQLILSNGFNSSSEMWIDESGIQDVTLNNVEYDYNKGAYYFSGNSSCGLTNRSIITNGDFTVEMAFLTETTNGDLSLIAQKNFGSNNTGSEVGRFKPFNILNGILRFFGTNSSNSFIGNYLTNFSINNVYYLTAVKKNNVVNLYVNGALIKTFSASDFAMSPGTVQIGCYNDLTSQNFKGWIYSVRMYNRSLTNDEIRTNLLTNIQQVNNSMHVKEFLLATVVTGNRGFVPYTNVPSKYVYASSKVDNNFVSLGENLWRILSLEENSLKLMSSEPYGLIDSNGDLKGIAFDDGLRLNNFGLNTFCSTSTTSTGCSVFAKTANFVTNSFSGSVDDDSSLLTYLNSTAYNLFNNVEKSHIVEHDFSYGPVSNTTNTDEELQAEVDKYKWHGKVGTFSVLDISLATYSLSSHGYNGAIAYATDDNWIFKHIANKGRGWTMNLYENSNNTYDVFTLATYNTMMTTSPRTASRTEQELVIDNKTVMYQFYVYPVIYYDISSLQLKGIGTVENPYTFY